MLLLAAFVAIPIAAKLGYDRWQDRKYERRLADEAEDRRKGEAQLAAYQREHEERTFYCFSVESSDENDTPCYRGKDACEEKRVAKLRALTGAQVGTCMPSAAIWMFTYACPDDPAQTCYHGQYRQNDCERNRAQYVGKWNNLTPCSEAR